MPDPCSDRHLSENHRAWAVVEADSRERASRHRDAMIDLLQRVPRPSGPVSRHAELAVARDVARELRLFDGADAWCRMFPHGPRPPGVEDPRARVRQVPGDHVAVHADVLLRMQMEHEECLAALHHARELLARVMSTRRSVGGVGTGVPQADVVAPEIVAELQASLRGMARVAGGLPWSGDDE